MTTAIRRQAEQAAKGGKRYTQVYDIESKILGHFRAPGMDYVQYRNELLFQEGHGLFHANMYPIARHDTANIPEHYEKVFGYGRRRWKEYDEVVRDVRFKMLLDLWIESQPKTTICFGKTYWAVFRQLLKIKETSYDSVISVVACPDKRILLTPFFWNCSMGTDRIAKVIEIMKTKHFGWSNQ